MRYRSTSAINHDIMSPDGMDCRPFSGGIARGSASDPVQNLCRRGSLSRLSKQIKMELTNLTDLSSGPLPDQ